MGGRDHLTSPNLGGLDKFVTEPTRVDKPWGHELIWAVAEEYAGKILFVKAGESLSLQFHNVRTRPGTSSTGVRNSSSAGQASACSTAM